LCCLWTFHLTALGRRAAPCKVGEHANERSSNDPSCTGCSGPITGDQRSVRLHFANDPKGYRGFSGFYHEHCSKPFAALARAINMLSFNRF